MKTYSFTVNGETYKGTRDKLIGFFEAIGYQAERDEQNPHVYWQYAEHLKRGER